MNEQKFQIQARRSLEVLGTMLSCMGEQLTEADAWAVATASEFEEDHPAHELLALIRSCIRFTTYSLILERMELAELEGKE